MTAYLYLLSHKNGTRFKVGKANDIIARARCFGLHEIDWSSSAGFEVSSARKAYELETSILAMFSEAQLEPSEVLAKGGVRDGSTEWLRAGCRERVEAYLEHVIDLKGHVRICGATLTSQVEKLLAPLRRTLAERAQRSAVRAARQAELDAIRQARARKSKEILQAELSRARDILWEEMERHAYAGTIAGMSLADGRPSLILVDDGTSESLWWPKIEDTRFAWPGGQGSLVSSILNSEAGAAQVCVVGLGRWIYDFWPDRSFAEPILGRVAAFARSLTTLDEAPLRAAIWNSIIDSENKALSRHCDRVVDNFLDKHLPSVHTRKAAELSGHLF